MHPVLKVLVAGLEQEEKDAVVRRVEAMNSELTYLEESKQDELKDAKGLGWTSQKLHVAFCLNSFYQRILAPLWASSMSASTIGSKIPIRYGKSIVFDTKRNAKIDKMGMMFLELCKRSQITRSMLEAQRASDLIWQIKKRK